MRALLIKDFYTLLSQMKVFIVLLVLFEVAFKGDAGVFAIFYAMMLPVTSLAYDEQSKWPQLAIMLPYSIKELVLSKYVLGWLLSLAVTGISLLLALGNTDMIFTIIIIWGIALGFLALTLPLIFWLGTEKGRLLLIAVLAGILGMIGAMGFISRLYGYEQLLGSDLVLCGVGLIGVVLINLVSMLISIKLYKRRLMQS